MSLPENDKPIRCMICDEECEEGIVLLDHLICTSCEQEIVHTNAEDEKYDYFVYQMRAIFSEGTNQI